MANTSHLEDNIMIDETPQASIAWAIKYAINIEGGAQFKDMYPIADAILSAPPLIADALIAAMPRPSSTTVVQDNAAPTLRDSIAISLWETTVWDSSENQTGNTH